MQSAGKETAYVTESHLQDLQKMQTSQVESLGICAAQSPGRVVWVPLEPVITGTPVWQTLPWLYLLSREHIAHLSPDHKSQPGAQNPVCSARQRRPSANAIGVSVPSPASEAAVGTTQSVGEVDTISPSAGTFSLDF